MRLSVFAFAAVMAPVLLPAIQTHSFEEEGYAIFAQGRLDGFSLRNDGLLKTAPKLTPVAKLDESVILSAVQNDLGDWFVGTGDAGTVLKVSKEGEVETIFETEQVLSRALAIDSGGDLYVGTSPNGAVYRVPQDGSAPVVVFDPEAVYVWDLEIEGNFLWVATGVPAGLHRVDLHERFRQSAELWWECPDEHVTDLEMANGTIYLGSSRDGVLYRIEEKNRARAIYNPEQEEIRTIASDDEGNLAFVAVAATSTEETGGFLSEEFEDGGGLPPLMGTEEFGTASPVSNKGVLYLMRPDGYAEAIWQSTDAGIFSLEAMDTGSWVFGLSERGKVFGIQSRSDWSLVYQVPERPEVSLIKKDVNGSGAIFVFTSNPAAIYRIGGEGTEPVRYTSKPRDFRQYSRMGMIEVLTEGEIPLAVETRTGNTSVPDRSWSPWEAVVIDLQRETYSGMVPSPPARFLQYRIVVEDSSAPGAVRRVRGYYQLPNSPPALLRVEVLPFGVEKVLNRSNGSVFDWAKIFQRGGVRQIISGTKERMQLRRLENTGLLSAAWVAADPNGDTLRFRVDARRNGGDRWAVLAENLSDPFMSFNVRGWEDGYYEVRVSATDAPSNSAADAETALLTSSLFLVDNHAPKLELTEQRRMGQGRALRCVASDDWSVISSAKYVLDGQEPVEIFPEDGIFDSREETFVIELERRAGAAPPRSLIIEVSDEAGHLVSRTFQSTMN